MIIRRRRTLVAALLAVIACLTVLLISVATADTKSSAEPVPEESAARITSEIPEVQEKKEGLDSYGRQIPSFSLDDLNGLSFTHPALFESTAYGPPWDAMQGTGITSTGIPLNGPACVVAVDPDRIPYYTDLLITPKPHSECITYRALDTGGAIVGNRIDFYDWRGRDTQMAWGRQPVRVSIVE